MFLDMCFHFIFHHLLRKAIGLIETHTYYNSQNALLEHVNLRTLGKSPAAPQFFLFLVPQRRHSKFKKLGSHIYMAQSFLTLEVRVCVLGQTCSNSKELLLPMAHGNYSSTLSVQFDFQNSKSSDKKG